MADRAEARKQAETERFALNVFIKNYTFGEPPTTTILDGTWKARCRRVKGARVPTARCRLSWDSDHAHWVAKGKFRGAVKIGRKRYRRFRWRFRVTETCVGDACSLRDPADRVRRHLWKGRGINTPA